MPGLKATLAEFKHRTLHSGSKTGPVVKSRKQAIAIALSEERKAKGDEFQTRPGYFNNSVRKRSK